MPRAASSSKDGPSNKLAMITALSKSISDGAGFSILPINSRLPVRINSFSALSAPASAMAAIRGVIGSAGTVSTASEPSTPSLGFVTSATAPDLSLVKRRLLGRNMSLSIAANEYSLLLGRERNAFALFIYFSTKYYFLPNFI